MIVLATPVLKRRHRTLTLTLTLTPTLTPTLTLTLTPSPNPTPNLGQVIYLLDLLLDKSVAIRKVPYLLTYVLTCLLTN